MAGEKKSADLVPVKKADKVQLVEHEVPPPKSKSIGGKIARVLTSFPTLFILNVLYVILGAEIFSKLESHNERQECFSGFENYNRMENASITLMMDLAERVGQGLMQTEEGGDIVKKEYTEVLRKFSQSVLHVEYNVSKNCSLLGLEGGPQYKWSWTGSLVFATTVTTTIGYGVIAPVTNWGRLTCIVYALVGIPLMLLCLTSIGEIFAQIFQYIYATFCCCGFCKRKKKKEKPIEDTAQWIARQAYSDDSDNESEYDDDDEEEDYHHASVPLTISLLMLLAFTFLGAAVFSIWENWTFINAAYFCFVTYSTVGFGDIVPGTDNRDSADASTKLFTVMLYETLGIAWLSMCFELVQDELIAKFRWIAAKIGCSKPKQEMLQ